MLCGQSETRTQRLGRLVRRRRHGLGQQHTARAGGHIEQGRGFSVHGAAPVARAVLALEGGNRRLGQLVLDAAARGAVAHAGQLVLEPGRVRRQGGVERNLGRHLHRVGPGDQAGIGQLLPGEARARVLLAAGCDVRVADDALGPDVVALGDVAHQGNDLVHLRLRVGRVDAAQLRVLVAGVDDLDADGRRIQIAVPRPEARPRMPGPPVLIHQLVDRRRLVPHQVMRAHLPARGQHLQRFLPIQRRVVQDDEQRSAVLRHGGIRPVDLGAGGFSRRAGGRRAGTEEQGEGGGVEAEGETEMRGAGERHGRAMAAAGVGGGVKGHCCRCESGNALHEVAMLVRGDSSSSDNTALKSTT